MLGRMICECRFYIFANKNAIWQSCLKQGRELQWKAVFAEQVTILRCSHHCLCASSYWVQKLVIWTACAALQPKWDGPVSTTELENPCCSHEFGVKWPYHIEGQQWALCGRDTTQQHLPEQLYHKRLQIHVQTAHRWVAAMWTAHRITAQLLLEAVNSASIAELRYQPCPHSAARNCMGGGWGRLILWKSVLPLYDICKAE